VCLLESFTQRNGGHWLNAAVAKLKSVERAEEKGFPSPRKSKKPGVAISFLFRFSRCVKNYTFYSFEIFSKC